MRYTDYVHPIFVFPRYAVSLRFAFPVLGLSIGLESRDPEHKTQYTPNTTLITTVHNTVLHRTFTNGQIR